MSADDYLLLAALVLASNLLWGITGFVRYLARKEAEKVLRRFVVASRTTQP